MKKTLELFKANALLLKGCDIVAPLKAKISGDRPTGLKRIMEISWMVSDEHSLQESDAN
jgi:hypothetical protein